MTTERLSIENEFIPPTNGELALPKEDFRPKPEEFFREIIEKGIGGSRLAVVHGSYVYLDSGPLNRTYHETFVYQDNTFVRSDFQLVEQPPDVDVVLVVKSLEGFAPEFIKYVEESGMLDELNHFIEMTVITEDVLIQEIDRTDPSGMKRIFGLKPLIGIGETDLMQRLRDRAAANITDNDRAFQRQYEARKDLYRDNAMNGVTNFTITRDQFQADFPQLLEFYDTGSTSIFPEERIKLTIPKPLKLRSWAYLDSNGDPIDTSNMKIND